MGIDRKLRPRLFIPGPTNLTEETFKAGNIQFSYFRDDSFTKLNLENEKLLLRLMECRKGRVLPLTCSGTGAMEATILNLIKDEDIILVINGGPFGTRWRDMVCFFGHQNIINFDADFGKDIDIERLRDTIERWNVNVIFMQSHETSSGQKYDVEEIGKLAKEYNCLLIVDAIGSFLADEYKMDGWNVDATITSTQKGLQLSSGMAYVVLSKKAIGRIDPRSYYFDFSRYLDDYNLGRGHTPFTPNVSMVYQMNQKLNEIMEMGIDEKIRRMHDIANKFRSLCRNMPLQLVPETPSNLESCFIITEEDYNAIDLYNLLKDKYNIFIWHSGKQISKWLKNPVRRHFIVAHNGCTMKDHTELAGIMEEYFHG